MIFILWISATATPTISLVSQARKQGSILKHLSLSDSFSFRILLKPFHCHFWNISQSHSLPFVSTSYHSILSAFKLEDLRLLALLVLPSVVRRMFSQCSVSISHSCLKLPSGFHGSQDSLLMTGLEAIWPRCVSQPHATLLSSLRGLLAPPLLAIFLQPWGLKHYFSKVECPALRPTPSCLISCCSGSQTSGSFTIIWRARIKPRMPGPTPRVFDSVGLGWDPIICSSNKPPGDADAAGPVTTLPYLPSPCFLDLWEAFPDCPALC